MDVDQQPPYVEIYSDAPLMCASLVNTRQAMSSSSLPELVNWCHGVHRTVDAVANSLGLCKVKALGDDSLTCLFSISPDMPSRQQAEVMLHAAQQLLATLSQVGRGQTLIAAAQWPCRSTCCATVVVTALAPLYMQQHHHLLVSSQVQLTVRSMSCRLGNQNICLTASGIKQHASIASMSRTLRTHLQVRISAIPHHCCRCSCLVLMGASWLSRSLYMLASTLAQLWVAVPGPTSEWASGGRGAAGGKLSACMVAWEGQAVHQSA